jgi:hypothetical protein
MATYSENYSIAARLATSGFSTTSTMVHAACANKGNVVNSHAKAIQGLVIQPSDG